MTSPDRTPLAEAVEGGDVDDLVRWVDRLCAATDWDGLVELRDRCRRALERGKQLWPVASLAEYRLALEAPGPWAASVLVEGAGFLALGPLPEVAAARHTWAELAPHAPRGPLAVLAAHERVVRGEDLSGERLDAHVLDLPAVLQAWEPVYACAEYHADRAHFPSPAAASPRSVRLPRPGRRRADPDAVGALRGLVEPWITESNGRCDAVAVEGDALAAVAALGPPQARVAEIGAADALAWLGWAGASGGAHGRRRGAARGRFEAWWTLAALAGLLDLWPVEPDELGDAAGELRWFSWDAGEPTTGWAVRLAVHDPAEGLAWAVTASDMR